MVEIICPRCNFSKDVPEEKIPPGVKWANCPRCRHRFELPSRQRVFESAPPEPPPGSEGGREGIPPWEQRGELGLWRSLVQTCKAVLLSSESLFRTMDTRAGIREPLAFGLLCGSIGALFGFFWEFLMMWGTIASLGSRFFGWISMNILFLGFMVSVPLFVLINMFVTAGILHLCLRLVKGGESGFEGTFRVVAYAQTTQIFGVIPFIGGLVGWVWHLIVEIIGLREIHETTYTRVVIALLIPFAFILLVVVAFLVPLLILL